LPPIVAISVIMYLDNAVVGAVIAPPKKPVVPPTGDTGETTWLVVEPVVVAGAAVVMTITLPAVSGG
jgi:hypothetical protein